MSGIPKPLLRVTKRCLEEDLGIAGRHEEPTQDLESSHAVISAFCAQRGQNPAGQEIITDLKSRIVAWSLHAGRFRGATWHDEEDAVVWLLAAAMHRSGEASDAYPHFRELDRRARLLPTEEDLAALEAVRRQSFASALMEEVPRFCATAREIPGTVYPGLLAGRIKVRLLYEAGEVPTTTVAISQRFEPGTMEIPERWLMAVVAAFFPTTPAERVEPQWSLGDYPLNPDEVAYWEIDERGD